MHWEAIAAVGELLGAAGVIISLLYVAAQIRQSSRVSKAATRQALADGLQRAASDLVTIDDVARIFQAHLEGKELEPHQMLRIQARAYRDFRFWDNAFYQYSQGMLDDEEWRGLRENLKLLLHVPAYADYWSREHSLYTAAFQREVAGISGEGLVAERGSLIFDSMSSGAAGSEEG